MVMSFPEYFDFKSRVEAKTTGGNVHTVNGKLSLILNSIGLCTSSSYRNGENSPLFKENFPIYAKIIEETIQEIHALTGVWP